MTRDTRVTCSAAGTPTSLCARGTRGAARGARGIFPTWFLFPLPVNSEAQVAETCYAEVFLQRHL